MSSVAAVLSRRGAPPHAAVERMLSAAPHRGPEHEIAALDRCVLGASHSGGRGAWVGRYGRYTVAVAGVLDNLQQVCSGLPPGSRPSTGHPAEVIAAAFADGSGVIPAGLRGVFGAAVTDGERLWCFRDHLGFGTMFYRHAPEAFYAATEAKQVVAGAGLGKEPDLDVVQQVFWGTFDDRTPSALEGVDRLRKATLLEADHRGARVRRYWDPASLLERSPVPADERRPRFELLMEQAVLRAMRGDDIVALSGGVDSPAVAAFAAPLHERRFGSPLPALSAVYPDAPSVDELPYIKIVAERFGMPLHTIQYRRSPMTGLREWAELFDGPVPTIAFADMEEYYRRVSELGFRTILTGDLAEYMVEMRGHLLAHLLLHGRFRALAEHVAGQRAKRVPLTGVARQMAQAFVPAPALRWYERLRPTYRRAPIPEWLDVKRVKDLATSAIRPARDRWLALQRLAFEGPGLSVEANDVIQAVCGVRVRRPWADVDLWQFFLGLPAEQKFPDVRGKGLVRELLKGRVPDEILDRQDKTVFNESLLARIDYPTLRRWLVDPPVRLPGVDYGRLKERLERADLTLADYVWAKDLTSAHAFLSLW